MSPNETAPTIHPAKHKQPPAAGYFGHVDERDALAPVAARFNRLMVERPLRIAA